jgi:hypothetical protein
MIKCESTIVPVGAQSVIKILYYESMMVNYDFTSVISGPKLDVPCKGEYAILTKL